MSDEVVTQSLTVNGESRTVALPVHHTLLEVLREELGLTGTKHGCELGECGACTVLVDGQPVLSCLALAAEMEGRAIETVEGLQQGNALHPLQAAFADLGAAQCGYCTPGILMTAKALLAENPAPVRDQIRAALAAVEGRGLLETARKFLDFMPQTAVPTLRAAKPAAREGDAE